MLTHKFSKREKLLLLVFIVLLVGSLYYLLVDQPVRSTITEAQSRQAAAESQLTVVTAKLQKMRQMQEALDKLSSDTDAIVPDYDNARLVVDLLNKAMLNTYSYNMTFRPLVTNERIISRTIDINFECDSYATAKGIIAMLHNGPYRCEISATAMSLSKTARQAAKDAAAAVNTAAAATADPNAAAETAAMLAAVTPSLVNSSLEVKLTATFYEFIP